MGSINYRVMIVTCSAEKAVDLRHEFFQIMFKELSVAKESHADTALLTSAVVSEVFFVPINPDTALIFIKPTGSKEGWAPAEAWKLAIRKIEAHCEKTPGAIWALFSMGGDDDDIGMIRSKY
jgi:hypothetical protein